MCVYIFFLLFGKRYGFSWNGKFTSHPVSKTHSISLAMLSMGIEAQAARKRKRIFIQLTSTVPANEFVQSRSKSQWFYNVSFGCRVFHIYCFLACRSETKIASIYTVQKASPILRRIHVVGFMAEREKFYLSLLTLTFLVFIIGIRVKLVIIFRSWKLPLNCVFVEATRDDVYNN